jgi:hypothetical protein
VNPCFLPDDHGGGCAIVTESWQPTLAQNQQIMRKYRQNDVAWAKMAKTSHAGRTCNSKSNLQSDLI